MCKCFHPLWHLCHVAGLPKWIMHLRSHSWAHQTGACKQLRHSFTWVLIRWGRACPCWLKDLNFLGCIAYLAHRYYQESGRAGEWDHSRSCTTWPGFHALPARCTFQMCVLNGAAVLCCFYLDNEHCTWLLCMQHIPLPNSYSPHTCLIRLCNCPAPETTFCH